MTEILYAPDNERVVSTNAWAFLHWLRTTRGIELDGWTALQQWSAAAPADFRTAVAAFVRLPERLRTVPNALVDTLAEVLLHGDLRPDDRLLVVGAAWPWRAAELEGATVIHAGSTDLLATAGREQASVLAAPIQSLAEAAFRQPRARPNLASLRTIIATGGPLSPEARRRIYTWVKSDLMLLARTGDTFWGNPLEPVLSRPPATPAFGRRPKSASN